MPETVLLIHNCSAGNGEHNLGNLIGLIAQAGYSISAFSVDDDLNRILALPSNLIVVAGGDGTLKKVACKASPDGAPLAILPLGTANNVARSLGISGSTAELVSSWRTMRRRPFYRLRAEGPWGSASIIEGIGVGCIEHAIEEMASYKPGIEEAREWIGEAAWRADTEELELWLDDEKLTGHFLLCELSNIPFIGPGLRLAPTANPSDRPIYASLLGGKDEDRNRFADWLRAGPTDEPPPVAVRSARRIMLTAPLRRVRLNNHNWTAQPGCSDVSTVVVEAETAPLHFLAPAATPLKERIG